MNNVAYAERDLKFIKKRNRIYLLYRGFRKIYSKLLKYENRQIKSVLLYPLIKEERDLSNILNRIAWAIPFREDIKVFIPVKESLRDISIKSLTPLESQMPYLDKLCLDHIFLIGERDIRQHFQSDALLVHKWKSILSKNIIIRLYKTFIVDEYFFDGVEASTYQYFYYNTLSEYGKKELERISKENFQRLVEINNGKQKAYCFATGPSFDKYKDFSYEENSFKVICNTTVKNNEFLDFIKKPDLLVFLDPAFHFGPSKYAHVFREHAKDVIEKYDCFVMVSETLAPLILYHYPQLKKNIIGMRRTGKTFNFPTVEKFWTCLHMSGNILTYLMLPVASSISKEIYILGADGRKPDENYYWKHSKNAQFSDLMETVWGTHPSFVRDVEYQDFYEKNCESFEDLCLYGESLGKRYISLTQSYIPAMKRRQKKQHDGNDDIKTKT